MQFSALNYENEPYIVKKLGTFLAQIFFPAW